MAKIISVSITDEMFEYLDYVREKTGAGVSWQVSQALNDAIDDPVIAKRNMQQELG